MVAACSIKYGLRFFRTETNRVALGEDALNLGALVFIQPLFDKLTGRFQERTVVYGGGRFDLAKCLQTRRTGRVPTMARAIVPQVSFNQ